MYSMKYIGCRKNNITKTIATIKNTQRQQIQTHIINLMFSSYVFEKRSKDFEKAKDVLHHKNKIHQHHLEE